MSSPNIRDIIMGLSQRTKVAAVIRETRPMKAIRDVALAFTLTLIGASSMAHPSLAQAQAISPVTTGVMVIVTVKEGVTREQVMAVMPAEIRQTVQLYLNGKVREWYSRADGRGAVFLLDVRDVAEAHAIMEDLPLAKQNLMDHEYIAVGPLMPLRLLMANP
ncbi:hypothetical protein V1283_002857 [Bradyrhizobium sp. AZCC 2262]|uniref:muconolactone Delta-isomerase family protein n=1 Tax=Bradyrhizobium sp. AZCC 2262 TaxID=3117022 RepID=UPI002FF0D344